MKSFYWRVDRLNWQKIEKIFKEFAGIDAFPITLRTNKAKDIIQTIKNISPSFGGINLEDISAPRCFEIENRLQQSLNIPVIHDDQHGTAVVVLAALINVARLMKRDKSSPMQDSLIKKALPILGVICERLRLTCLWGSKIKLKSITKTTYPNEP